MAITKLSQEAQFISELVSNAGCVTISQVIQIMHDIKEEIGEDTTRKIITILCKKQLIKQHMDIYLTPYHGSPKVEIIPSIWFFIDRIHKLKNPEMSKEQNRETLMNAWNSLFTMEHPDQLCIFIPSVYSQKTVCFTTCNIDIATTSIIDMKEMRFINDKAMKKTRKSLEDAVEYVTTFIIHNDNDLEEWSEIFQEKHVSFDYYLCFINDAKNKDIPQIDVYKKS